jgi:hypothetical protein
MTDPDPRMVNAALEAAYPTEHRAARIALDPDDDPDYPEDFAEFIAGVRPTMERILRAALAVDPLRQADTVPVDRDIVEQLRDICRDLGYFGIRRRLPGQEQP